MPCNHVRVFVSKSLKNQCDRYTLFYGNNLVDQFYFDKLANNTRGSLSLCSLRYALIPRRATSRVLFIKWNGVASLRFLFFWVFLLFVSHELRGDWGCLLFLRSCLRFLRFLRFLGGLGNGLLGSSGSGCGLFVGFLGDDLVGVGDVPPAKPHVVTLLGTGDTARLSLGVASTALVFLGSLLVGLGLTTGALVLVGGLALEEPPDTVDQVLLVAPTNLEVVILAELVENPGGAVVEVIAVLHGAGVLDLVGLENLLALGFGRRFRNRLLDDVLEDPLDDFVHKVDDGLLDLIGVEGVLGDEGVNDGLDGRHFLKTLEKVLKTCLFNENFTF